MPKDNDPTLNRLMRAAIDPRLPPEIRAGYRRAAELGEKLEVLRNALAIKRRRSSASTPQTDPETNTSSPAPSEPAPKK